MNIVRHLLNQAEQVVDKAIVDHLQVIDTKPLHTRHLVHELQQKSMQTRICVSTAIDELKEAGEACLAYQAEAEAFSCLEEEGAFWEGSSSSTSSKMRDKVASAHQALLVSLTRACHVDL